MSFSLSQRKINLLDVLGHHFADTLIYKIKAGKKLQGVGDNWDILNRGGSSIFFFEGYNG